MTNLRICIVLLTAGGFAIAQQNAPELTGLISFNVHSASGRVETLAFTVGDGGTGPYKAILAGDSSLPTHTIYRPRDLGSFGNGKLLPIVAFGNGGCRNGSGEFRNFLSDIASHGYLVIAIGPAGDAVVAGSEGRTGQTQPQQLLDGVDWAVKQNELQGSEYFHKVETSKVAVMGQSCGTWQAMSVSNDPRVTTTVLLNGGGNMGGGRGGRGGNAPTAQANSSPATPGNTSAPASNVGGIVSAFDRMNHRYAPYAPSVPPAPMSGAPRAEVIFHGPVAYINGGASDIAFNGARAGFDALQNVPALFAYQDIGHYPATYREPNGGAFAVLANAWLGWALKDDQSASKTFMGANCGLCSDPKWKIQMKNLPK